MAKTLLVKDLAPTLFLTNRLQDGHLASLAVEEDGEAAAVVDQEEVAGLFCALVDWAKTEFVLDTVL